MSLTFKLLSTILLVSIFTGDAVASDGVPCLIETPPETLGGGWGTFAASVNKKPVVAMGGWGAVVAPTTLAADETAYKHATHDVFNKTTQKVVPVTHAIVQPGEAKYNTTTHGVFNRGTHEADLRANLAQLKANHKALGQINFALSGALGFAKVIKGAHVRISAYLGAPGKSLLGSLAAGEGTPWAEDATIALLAPLNVATIPETLADGATAISTLSIAQAFAILDGADSADKGALIAGLQAAAGRINAAASDTSGTDTLEALLGNLKIRAFINRVG